MEDFKNIATDIEQHIRQESELHVRNNSVGRAYITLGKKSMKVWIVNRPYQATHAYTRTVNGDITGTSYTGITDTYINDGSVVAKNTKLGRELSKSFQGTYPIQTPAGTRTYTFHNSCTYSPQGSSISGIKIGIDGKGGFYVFKSLAILKSAMTSKEESVRQNEEKRLKLEEEKKKAEAEKLQKEREYQIALKRAQDEDAERQLRIQKEKEEAARLEEERIREEERLKLEKEKEELSSSLESLCEKYKNAVSFIRQQASLRNQPILDEHQINIKFDSLFDDSILIIDGGPGTGKTTTLIQRLKFQIEEESLKEYIELSKPQADVLFDEQKDWMFFSPTSLLRLYLKDNMEYEGLTHVGEKTKVWKEFRKTIARDYYRIAGDDTPFRFAPQKYRRSELFNSEYHMIVKNFTNYYLDTIKEKIQGVADIDISDFSWKTIGTIIQNDCKNADIKDIPSLIRFINKLAAIHSIKPINANNDIDLITKTYSVKLNDALLTVFAKVKREESLYENLLAYIREQRNQSIMTDEDVDGEIEENEITEEDESQDLELLLKSKLRNLLAKIARKKFDSKSKLSTNDNKLLKFVEQFVEETNLESIGQAAFFMRYFNPLLKGIEPNILNPICPIYKRYRKDISKRGSTRWNGKLLEHIIKEGGNKFIHPNELSLLIGFINNIALKCYTASPLAFKDMNHKYISAYKELCRPVIGIDEATDYTIMDYYAISSLRHYVISTITLSGDLMQCLEEKGIKDWQELNVIFPKLNVQELCISYRQSPKLMNVGVELYKNSIGKTPPYRCYLTETDNIPSPLAYANNDPQSKADWIIERILEVKKAYGTVPSIAIFFTDKNDIPAFKELMEDNGELEESGIDIKDCSSGDTLTNPDTIRLFPIDLIKGMEFEVVFFNDLDKLIENGQSFLIDKYLYVGLSRAAFYMGITLSNEKNKQLANILPLFEKDSNWSLTRNDD